MDFRKDEKFLEWARSIVQTESTHRGLTVDECLTNSEWSELLSLPDRADQEPSSQPREELILVWYPWVLGAWDGWTAALGHVSGRLV